MIETQATPTEISVGAKERLARLLAAENVTVEHRNVPTAMFDIKNRVLILPNWKDITKDIYDLLVLHEVGHALWTPLAGWHGAISGKGANFKGFLNVVEDARIEKRIKRKFPGGRRSFTQGYKELLDRDFFGLADKDANDLNLIDRINIHFKGGASMGIRFDSEELPFVKRIEAAESWGEVEAIANDLWDFMAHDAPITDITNPRERGEGDDDGDTGESGPGDEEDGDESFDGGENPFGNDTPDGESETDDEAPKGESPTDGEGDEAGDDTDDDGDDSEGTDSPGGEDGSDSGSDGEDDASPTDDGEATGEGDVPDFSEVGEGSFGGEPFSETDKAFREKEESLVDTEDNGPVYVQVPKDEAFNLDGIIVPNSEIVKALKKSASEHDENALTEAASNLKAYRNANTKVVGYLAKEFEMRKAADASKRTTISKTGVLDTNTLHSYKWNDDIFKKVATVSDGKSHGLQMFVDWSGSMSSNMFGTLDQILNLVLFCKKVGIPFDVYAFSNCYDARYYADSEEVSKARGDRMHKDKLETGDLTLRNAGFNLLQIATSKGNRAAFNDMLLGLIILRGHFNHYGRYGNPSDAVSYFRIPGNMGLGGTPLNEAVMASIPVINRFRAENRLQIVNSVFLTDGCGSDMSDAWNHDEPIYRRWGNNGSTIVRDRKSRKEFILGNYGSPDSQIAVLLNIVRIRTGVKIVNFYVANPRPNAFKGEYLDSVPTTSDSRYPSDEEKASASAALKTARAEGGVVIEDSIYGWDHHYLLMGGESLGVSGDEGLDESLVGAKKGTLKRAFAKSSTGKLRNRVVLRKFTEMIAV